MAGDGEGGADAEIDPVANHKPDAGSETEDRVTSTLGGGLPAGENVRAGEIAVDDRPFIEFHSADNLHAPAQMPQHLVDGQVRVEDVALIKRVAADRNPISQFALKVR